MTMVLMVGMLVAAVVAACVVSVAVGRNAAIVCSIGGALLLGATFCEAQFSDRWASSNISAEDFAESFAHVPMQIGDWQGEDQPVTDEVLEVAGAVGCVSRSYTNQRTGQRVSLWLIVGHARDVCNHTPDICYPSSGFHKQSRQNIRHTMALEETDPADFWTNSFIKEDASGRALERVFWTWYKPNENGNVRWEAPEYQTFRFGNARALYKMYFMSSMPSPTQTADESVCIEFAKQLLPELQRVLIANAPGSETTGA